MLNLNNVTKTYFSKKKKRRVDALRGVSFELGNTGMVFILGKSGSGKSTLLNMLGGLDSPTEGEIIVDGVSMKDFKQADYEGYRNGYVGFIFQEFNLLDEFNVKDNIALSLHLSKGGNIDEKVVTALKQVELSEDYLTRRVDEMSGGEKQRIAIARTIVKECKMILADEPTGNLDSVTSESIWNILKAQSKTKLVVVVSHDRESAEKYGDRVIEIADGKIISDKGSISTDIEVKEPFKPQKNSLSLKASLKLGVNNLFQHKFRSICVVAMSILSIFALMITEMFLMFSFDLTIVKFIQQNNVDYFVVNKIATSEEGKVCNAVPRSENISYLDENSTYIKYSPEATIGFIQGKQDILDMGWTFVGDALELDLDSYYTSSYVFNEIERGLDKGYKDVYFYLDENDNKVYINEKPSSWEFLVGKRINTGRVEYEYPPILAGIVDVSSVSDFAIGYIPEAFALEDFARWYWVPFISLNNGVSDVKIEFGKDKLYDGYVNISEGVPSFADIVISKDGIVPRDQFVIGENEIVLTFEMFSALFNAKFSWDYVTRPYQDYILHEIPEQIGQTYPFVLHDATTGEQVADLGELKIVGVSFTMRDYLGERKMCGLSKETIYSVFSKVCNVYLVNISSVGNIRSFVTKLSNIHSVKALYAGSIMRIDSERSSRDCVKVTQDFEIDLNFTAVIIAAVSGILLLIQIFMVINLISFSIANRKKEIGILSALGTTKRDIIKIFIVETLIICLIAFVTVMIFSFVFASKLNQFYSEVYILTLTLSFFRVDIVTVLVLAGVSIAFPLLAALIPLRTIAKLKPIDAIRNI